MTYIVYNKKECDKCEGGKQQFHHIDNQSDLVSVECGCDEGYIVTEVYLVDALRNLGVVMRSAEGITPEAVAEFQQTAEKRLNELGEEI